MKTLMTLAITVLSLSAHAQSTSNPCDYLIANFSTETIPAAGGIQFTDITQSNGITINNYHWDFGNGHQSTQKNPFMIFNEGVYHVSLTIMDETGCEKAITKSIEFSYGGQ